MLKLKNRLYSFIDNNTSGIDEDIFNYGIKIITKYIIFLVITVPIAIYNKNIISTVSFLLLYILIRQYLGGLHFKSNLVCLLISILITLSLPIATEFIKNFSYLHYLLIFILTIILTIIVGPIDHPNKRLSEHEKNKFKRKAIILEVSLIIVSTLFCLLTNLLFLNLTFTFIIIDFSLLFATFKSMLN